MKMRPFGRLLPLPTAIRRTMAAAVPVEATETVALLAAAGRVAARSYRAPRDVPEFARATWDGYALRSDDTRGARDKAPAALRLVGEAYAEQTLARPLGPGEAVAIATGAALPLGADAVIHYEATSRRRRTVLVPVRVGPGDRVAEPGDDIPRGTRLVEAGRLLGAADVGALGAAGFGRVRVYRRPRVALLSNGNELVIPGAALGRGQVHEVNSVTLGALVAASGGEPRVLPPLRDDPGAIERGLRAALRSSDVVVVTGGSSVGEHDYLPRIFPRLGRLLFHGVAVRPGKPTLVASAGGKLLLGMPGHPTSCLSNGFWLVLPALRRIARLPGPGWVDEETRLATALPAGSPTLTSIVPLHVDAGFSRPTFKDSSAITSLVDANAYLVRPPGSPALARGRSVTVRRLLPPLGTPPTGPR